MSTQVGIELVADTKKALDSIHSFGEKSSKAMTALKVAAVGALGVFASAKLVGAIGSAIDAASNQENAVNKLNSQLILNGEFTNDASQAMQDFASQMQATTGIGDETTIEMLALAKSFGLTNEQATNLVGVAGDLSAVTGNDLKKSVEDLSKTYAGTAGELAERIEGVRNLTKAELESGLAVDIISQKYGGAAAQALGTYSGAVGAAEGAFGDFLETIGEIFTQNPVIISFIGLVKTAFETMGQVVKDNQSGIKEFMNGILIGIVEATPKVVKALSSLLKGFITIGKGISTLTGGTAAFFLTILEGADDAADAFKILLAPIDAMAMGIAAISTFALEQELKSLQSTFEDQSKAYTEAQRTGADNQAELLAAAGKTRDAMGAIKTEIELLDKTGAIIAVEIENGGEKAKETLRGIVDSTLTAEGVLGKLEIKVDDTTASMVKTIGEYAETIKKAGTEIAKKDDQVAPAQLTFLERLEKIFGIVVEDMKEAFNTENVVKGISTVMEGKAGAVKTVGAGATAIAGAFGAAGPAAGAIGGLAMQLAQAGPEGTKKMVEEFAEALPDLIDGLADAFPVLIEVLVEKAPEIITAIIMALPRVVGALIAHLPEIAMATAFAIANAINSGAMELGAFFDTIAAGFDEFGVKAKEKITAAFDILPEKIEATYKLISEGIGSLFEPIVTAFTDNIIDPINELVGVFDPFIDFITDLLGINSERSIGDKPKDINPVSGFIEDKTGIGFGLTSGSSDNVEQYLSSILVALNKTQKIKTTVEFNSKTLADIMLQLDRNGARVTA